MREQQIMKAINDMKIRFEELKTTKKWTLLNTQNLMNMYANTVIIERELLSLNSKSVYTLQDGLQHDILIFMQSKLNK